MQDRFRLLVQELFDRGIRFEDARLELERLYIERALDTANRNLSRAAEALGMHRNTLTRKLAEQRRKAKRYRPSTPPS